jgi:ribose 5-phosphate isomerase A
MDERTALKKQAGDTAADTYIRSGMVVGLGSGSTAVWAVRRIGERLQSGDLTDIVGIPTSSRTEAEAIKQGIPLVNLTDYPHVEVTIDGADEFDPDLNLIKGGGGALLREKVVAQASQTVVIVTDDPKEVSRLGTTFKLPVEVVPFAIGTVEPFLKSLGSTPALRRTDDGEPFYTDNGNAILDCHFPDGIADVPALSQTLSVRAGIVEHGLFVGLAKVVIVAGQRGIRTVRRKND